MTETHIHHILPRYKGGTDDSENLVELTVTQHAMWHYASWRLWGNWQDRLAWQGLATRIPKDEIQQIRIREGRVKGGKTITPAKSEAARLNQKEAAKRMKELKTGVYALTREQSSLACKGKIWITDGQSTRRIYPDQQIPKGWKRGRTLK